MTSGDHGDSGMDIWGMDVARYGDYATLAYTNAKVQENYRAPVPDHVPQRGAARGAPAADDADPRPADRRPTRSGGPSFGLEHALWFQRAGPAARRGGDLPALERVGPGRGRGRRGPRARRHDRDLQLREVPGDRPGRRGLAVVAAHRPDAGGRPDHADRDAQRQRAGSSASSRSPGPPPATSSTCSARCRPRSITRAGSATICRPTASVWFEVLGLGLVGLSRDRAARRATCCGRSRRTSTSRPRRSRS